MSFLKKIYFSIYAVLIILLVLFSFSNHHSTFLYLNPFSSQDTHFSFKAPLFLWLFLFLAIGFFIGYFYHKIKIIKLQKILKKNNPN